MAQCKPHSHSSFERMEPSDFVRQRVEREVAGLEKRYGRITSCSVFVEGPGDHHRHGGLYAFRAALELPGGVPSVPRAAIPLLITLMRTPMSRSGTYFVGSAAN